MKYSIDKIFSIVGGEARIQDPSAQVQELEIDSRRILFPFETLFFAIQGIHNDGHLFIQEAYEKGVRNFIIERAIPFEKYPDVNFISVEDTITALQKLAAFHRDQFNIPVIGITGSNGKTIIKEWLHQLLAQEFQIIRSPKSFNSQVGVPLSVWPLNEYHELGIFEAGISQEGEMTALQKIIKPTIGIFSNIGAAHDEGFSSRRSKVKEKLQLFSGTEILIYCNDHHLVKEEADIFIKDNDHTRKFTWGYKEGDLIISEVTATDHGVIAQAEYKNKSLNFSLPFFDAASIENAFHCLAVMLYLEYDLQTATERIFHLHTLPLRLELKEALNNSTLIYDCYNSDLNSLKIALDFLDQQKQHKNKTVILSDILQSGKKEMALYEEVGKILSRKNINKFIGVGPQLQANQDNLKISSNIETYFYPSTDALSENIDSIDFNNETILLKGARQFAFEKIGKQLESKAHDTVLEINLNAIAHNLNVYKNYLLPNVKLMVMVKAFGYGTGSFELANLLQFYRVDYLAVAYADEGIELRKAGIQIPIMVMNPELHNLGVILKYHLEPEIYSFRILNAFIDAVNNRNDDADEKYKFHLKFDTGMHRLGFISSEVKAVAEIINKSKNIQVATVFSHLAGSESARHDEFTRRQCEALESISAELSTEIDDEFDRHILNSSGIIRFPEYQYEMVRLGIGLYGIDPSEEVKDQLMPISTLKSIISQIKNIPAGDTIGYDRKGKADKPMKMGIVAVGYADGISRKMSNGRGKMYVKGNLAPIVGNVCMDMTMIDISNIDDVKEGDEVIIFGKEIPIQQLAEWDETIPYEILTRISKRVKRIYFEE